MGRALRTLFMMTFINWESLLKITYAENTFSCLPERVIAAYCNGLSDL